MKLAAWRKAQKLSYGGAARALGLANASLVHKYENGRVPDPPRMALIIKNTAGQVTANDFHPAAYEVQS